MTARIPRRDVPFAAQSRDDPGPVLLAGERYDEHAFAGVVNRRLEDRRLPPVGQVLREGTLASVREPIPEPDVRERAADHHVVVAASVRSRSA